jgi:hypothetical protein
MIRVTSIVATVATCALLPISASNAATNINSRIELITNILQNDAVFSARNFSFSLNSTGGQSTLFMGIEGVRRFNDYAHLNSWMLDKADPKSVFDGGSYQFTHSVLDGYFSSASPASVEAEPVPTVFEGAPYKFTHSVLDSFFDAPAEPDIVAQSSRSEPALRMMMAPPPIPEPATWAMMIGGFALAGVALRARKVRLRTA